MMKFNRASESWPTRKLGDVLDIEIQAVVPKPGIAYRYLGLEHIEQQAGRILNAPDTDGTGIQSQKYSFRPYHVLYGKLRPNLNKVALPDFEGICSTDILPLSIRPNALREYVAYYLRSRSFVHYAVKHASGTKMPRFGPRQLLQAPIPLPPIPVQRRVVQILQKADEVRWKRRGALESAEIILSSSFNIMFGDPGDNVNGFERLPLGHLADVRSGVTKGRKLPKEKTVEVPYLRVANVQDGFLDLSELKTIEVLPDDVEKYHLEDGDILMTEGGDPDKLGRGTVWRNQIDGCIHQNHVFRVRTNRERLAPEYLAALLRTQYAKHYFLGCAKRSSNLASVNSTQVKAFPVPLPPIILQEKFVSAVEQWVQVSHRLTSGLKDADGMFASMMEEAFTGRLTAEWERANASWISAQSEIEERQPRLLLLALIRQAANRTKQVGQAAMLVTVLMKYVFLLQMEGNSHQQYYRFVPNRYGPFAKDINADLQRLNSEGLVILENDFDEAKARVTLADATRADAALADLADEQRDDLAAIIERYGELDHKALIKTVYQRYPAFAAKSGPRT